MQDLKDMFIKKVPEHQWDLMIRPVTMEEVKRVIFDIGDDKAPGLDGYLKKLMLTIIACFPKSGSSSQSQ
ncbi:hypothetical protein Pint_15904 [Pistacia integerrima]|uniref:Uncharacterized protein n=1 Tax=Pistacia integerrima TaxID=434235 RepID=A0ACC0ZBC2_9ROSI|nr:hypothetical protein Pint_15904 [Pistacia integerrima]